MLPNLQKRLGVRLWQIRDCIGSGCTTKTHKLYRVVFLKCRFLARDQFLGKKSILGHFWVKKRHFRSFSKNVIFRQFWVKTSFYDIFTKHPCKCKPKTVRPTKSNDWEPKCGRICKKGWKCACSGDGAPQKYTTEENEQRSCGAGPSSVVNGMDAEPGMFPWAVGIRIRTSSTREGAICGGTIINRRTILTAAHCFAEKSKTIDQNREKILMQHSKVFVGFPTYRLILRM